MHKALQLVVLTTGLAASALAGPTLACHEWVSTLKSVLGRFEPLRGSGDGCATSWRPSPQGPSSPAVAVKPGDPVSLLKAGYWAEVLHSMGVSPDTDGPEQMVT